jgi:DNA-binding LytR/AlgR family response regulator
MRIAICDDEIEFSAGIKNIIEESLTKNSVENEIKIFNSGAEIIEFSRNNNIDLAFLDIEMPKINGYMVAESLRLVNPNILIVFVTSYDEMLFYTCEYQPLGLIRKTHTHEIDSILSAALKKMESRSIAELTLNFKIGDKVFQEKMKNILYFESAKHYININALQYEDKCRGKLDELEKQLANLPFIRVHVGFLVNIHNIKAIVSNDLILTNGARIPLSRGNLKAAQQQFMAHNRAIL